MLCVVIKGPTFEEADHQIARALPYADLVELRLDSFTSLDLSALSLLRSRFTIPMIFTIRKTSDDLFSLLALKPEYLDLEAPISTQLSGEILSQYPATKLILSYHHFTETPENLDQVYKGMQTTPAYFYKMAVTAHHSLDMLKFICWAKSVPQLIAVSMGEKGQISRIIGPLMGCPITYAALDENQPSAPGQLSGETLINKYRHATLSPHTALYGLIGDPIHLSISDETHNAFFNDCSLDAVYVKMQVKPSELYEFLQGAKKLPFCGMSVTMPFKEQILDFLDEIDPEAKKIGAVNTLLFKDHRIIGFNTDGIGALNAIEKKCRVKDKQIIIIGAGGAAKAIAYEAIQRGGRVTILNRDKEKAIRLAHHFNCTGKGLDEMRAHVKTGYDILINCTPLPHPIASDGFIPGTIVMDITTKPKETLFLKEAVKRGCYVIYGYEMFIEQAIGQFKLWFKDRIKIQKSRALLAKGVMSLKF